MEQLCDILARVGVLLLAGLTIVNSFKLILGGSK